MRISLIDDHLLLLQALQSQLEALDETFEVSAWTDPIAFIESDEPGRTDLLLLDIHFNSINGFEALRQMKLKGFAGKLIVLSGSVTGFNLQRAIDEGANGFLGKDCSSEELKEAIVSLDQGDFFIGKSVEPLVKKMFTQTSKSKLSHREIDIVKLISQGFGYKEIGEQLFISPRTVEAHRNNILEKLELKTNAELVRFALRNHLI